VVVGGTIAFAIGFMAPFLMYAVSQFMLYPRAWRRLWLLPGLLPIGMGIAVSNTRGVWQAILGRKSEFVRTPKRGDHQEVGPYRPPLSKLFLLDLAVGILSAVAGGLYAYHGIILVGALLGVYSIGFMVVGLLTLKGDVERRTAVARPIEAPVIQGQPS
jgi:hypothetical protein